LSFRPEESELFAREPDSDSTRDVRRKKYAELDAYTIGLLEQAGIGREFLLRVTQSTEFMFPTEEELLKEHVVTQVSYGGGFSLSPHELAGFSPARLREDLVKTSMYAAYAKVAPERFSALN